MTLPFGSETLNLEPFPPVGRVDTFSSPLFFCINTWDLIPSSPVATQQQQQFFSFLSVDGSRWKRRDIKIPTSEAANNRSIFFFFFFLFGGRQKEEEMTAHGIAATRPAGAMRRASSSGSCRVAGPSWNEKKPGRGSRSIRAAPPIGNRCASPSRCLRLRKTDSLLARFKTKVLLRRTERPSLAKSLVALETIKAGAD